MENKGKRSSSEYLKKVNICLKDGIVNNK